MKDLIFIRVYKDGQVLEVKQFDQDQIVIGREGDIHVKLDDESVSPVHVVIEKRDSGYFACDMGSASGTYKNNQKVLDEQLQSGDQLQVGAFTVEFNIGVPKPASAAKPKVTATPPPPPPESISSSGPMPPPPPADLASSTPDTPPIPAFPGGAMAEVESDGKPFDLQAVQSIGTYAPESIIKNLNEEVKPSKGSIVEVIVSWQERIVNTFHFEEEGIVTIGSHPKNDIVLPVFEDSQISHPLLKIEGGASVYLNSDFKGELKVGTQTYDLENLMRNGKIPRDGVGFRLDLQQGSVLRVDFSTGLSFYIRYVSQVPKPLAAPPLSLTPAEITTLLLTGIFFGIFWIYLLVYTPEPPEEVEEKEVRKATFVYKRKERIQPRPKVATKSSKTRSQTKIKDKAPAPSRIQEGKAPEAAPNKSKSTKKILTAKKPGKGKGIRKARTSGKKADAGAKSKKRDVRKTGLLSVFGRKGTQDQLDRVYEGSGVVGGLSDQATGSGGAEALGAGNVAGTGLKDIGAGGTGTATVGIAGVGTKGRGGGRSGYGTGNLGGRRRATIIPGGEGEEFTGVIDRDAIRRVVQKNIRQIQACYERALNKDPDLYGKVVLRWEIDSRGRALNTSVKKTTLNSREVEKCMMNRLRTWKFPASPRNQVADVSYPFVFNSK